MILSQRNVLNLGEVVGIINSYDTKLYLVVHIMDCSNSHNCTEKPSNHTLPSTTNIDKSTHICLFILNYVDRHLKNHSDNWVNIRELDLSFVSTIHLSFALNKDRLKTSIPQVKHD